MIGDDKEIQEGSKPKDASEAEQENMLDCLRHADRFYSILTLVLLELSIVMRRFDEHLKSKAGSAPMSLERVLNIEAEGGPFAKITLNLTRLVQQFFEQFPRFSLLIDNQVTTLDLSQKLKQYHGSKRQSTTNVSVSAYEGGSDDSVYSVNSDDREEPRVAIGNILPALSSFVQQQL